MKKIIGSIIAAGLMLFTTSNVYATSSTTTTAGATVTIAAGTNAGGGGPLTFEPSPTTLMGWNTAVNEFSLYSVAANNLNNAAGMQYCAGSSTNGVYKKKTGSTVESVASVTAGATIDGYN